MSSSLSTQPTQQPVPEVVASFRELPSHVQAVVGCLQGENHGDGHAALDELVTRMHQLAEQETTRGPHDLLPQAWQLFAEIGRSLRA